MTNKGSSHFYIRDGHIILEEARDSFVKSHYHRVVRKCQEAAELLVKGFIRLMGLEYEKSHFLDKNSRKKIQELKIFSKAEFERLITYYELLVIERETSFYGSWNSEDPKALYDKDDAKDALDKCEWIFKTISAKIEGLAH